MQLVGLFNQLADTPNSMFGTTAMYRVLIDSSHIRVGGALVDFSECAALAPIISALGNGAISGPISTANGTTTSGASSL
jgi:hypothetical protein